MCHKIKFVYADIVPLPIVKFRLGDRSEHHALLDTGSEYSSFDESLSFKTSAEQKATITTFTGNTELKIKTAAANIILEDVNGVETIYNLSGVVGSLNSLNEHIKEVYYQDSDIRLIIGSKDLTKYNAKIDYQNKQLIINELSENKTQRL